MMIQQIPITNYGAAHVLAMQDIQAPDAPGPNEVAVDVAFSGINFADVQMRLGQYPGAPPRPFVPGYEVSGRIAAVGAQVAGFAVGDEVLAGTFFGGYTSRLIVPAQQVVKLADGLTLEEAAALPVNFITAWCVLHEMGRIREGDRVLVECATGGVGTLAIQMAVRTGATVVGLTTTAAKKDYIRALGAEALTVDEFMAPDGPTGFDFILNASGGSALRKQMKRLAICGRIVCIGLNSSVVDGKPSRIRMALAAIKTPIIPVLSLFDPSVGVFAFDGLNVLRNEQWAQRMTAKLANAKQMGLTPYVDRVFPAAEVAQAHRFLETRQAKGKVLLSWN